MRAAIEQGDLIRITRSSVLFLVISSDYYNQSGLVVVCPAVSDAEPDALHVPYRTDAGKGVILCEQLTSVSAAVRGYIKKDHLKANDLLEVIYRVQSIFDLFGHAE